MYRYVLYGVIGMVLFISLSVSFSYSAFVDSRDGQKEKFASSNSEILNIKEDSEVKRNEEIVERKVSESAINLDSLIAIKNSTLATFSEIIEVAKRVVTPRPLNQLALVGDLFSGPGLTRSGVVAWTNIKRIEVGLNPLSENASLNEVARLRLEDMFARGYFEHISPEGTSVSDVAENSSFAYEYIIIGENLALGGFSDDEKVVEAWMASPGHRDNILASRYQDIGVAVREDFYNGKKARMAVQVFGTPLNACPIPLMTLKNKVTTNKEELARLNNQLSKIKSQIDASGMLNPAENRNLTREHNRLVIKHNNLLEVTQATITEYNNQVKTFNQCVKL